VSTPTIAPPLPPPLWPDPPPPPPPPSESNPNPNRPYVIGMAVAAVMIPLLAIGWVVVSGMHGAAPKASAPKTVADNGIVNINGVIPNGFIAGTGMVLTSDGLVLTNNHVVANTSALTGQLADRGPVYRAVVVGVDPTQDVAVIQLEGAVGLPVTPFDLSGALAIGDPVTGRGNAGGLDGAPLSATGTVTSLDETIFVEDEDATIMETLDGVVCFNAPIRPGDSGGPLLESSGQVIGMDTAGALSNATGAAANWGCAVPITRAMAIAHDIESGTASPYIESGHRGILGVSVVTRSGSCVVTSVTPGNAAATAGLVAGDVITTVGGIPVPSMADLNVVMQDRRPGDDVTVVWRDASGATHSAVAVLSAGPPA
jgi:S1-C subfamily serine protease